MNFNGKVAVVTGGGNGIGQVTAVAFAAAGAKVVVVDHLAKAGEAVAGEIVKSGGSAVFVKADVTKSAEVAGYVAAAVGKYGRIDCLFNNAGIEGTVAPIVDYDDEIFDRVIAVNLRGVFLGLKHTLPVMIRQGSGAIVNTSSVAGIQGSPRISAYVASKHAVLGLTKSAAGEVARLGVRVNAVCPGPIDTRMMQSLTDQMMPSNPELAKAARAHEVAHRGGSRLGWAVRSGQNYVLVADIFPKILHRPR